MKIVSYFGAPTCKTSLFRKGQSLNYVAQKGGGFRPGVT